MGGGRRQGYLRQQTLMESGNNVSLHTVASRGTVKRWLKNDRELEELTQYALEYEPVSAEDDDPLYVETCDEDGEHVGSGFVDTSEIEDAVWLGAIRDTETGDRYTLTEFYRETGVMLRPHELKSNVEEYLGVMGSRFDEELYPPERRPDGPSPPPPDL